MFTLLQASILDVQREHTLFLHWLEYFLKRIGCQNISQLALFEAFETLRQILAKNFVRLVKVIWMNKKYSYLCAG
jgi:archaellum component FlaD/FlaE